MCWLITPYIKKNVRSVWLHHCSTTIRRFREIRESDRRDLSVSQALGYLNTVNCLSYGSSSTVSEITRNCRRIFELFGVDVPKEPQRDVQVCDLMRLADLKD